MKRIFMFILLFAFYSMTSCAQTKFTEGTITAIKEKFEVRKSSMVFNHRRPLYVHSKKNKYNGPLPVAINNYQFRVQSKDIHVNFNQVKEIVYRILIKKKQSLHDKNEKLGIWYVFDTNGNITDINFSLDETPVITPAEIELIDNELREKIKATFTGPSYKYYPAISYSLSDISF